MFFGAKKFSVLFDAHVQFSMTHNHPRRRSKMLFVLDGWRENMRDDDDAHKGEKFSHKHREAPQLIFILHHDSKLLLVDDDDDDD